MTIQISSVQLPVTKILDNNPLPFFRDRKDREIFDRGLLPEEKKDFAKNTGFRVLPYLMQDNYEFELKETELETIVLENEFLKATFLPTLGGRLYSLWDKQKNKELLFCNPVIKMGNLALRNAWFSGGIEWNFGHYGHTFLTCEPMFFARLTDEKGEPFLRMYEFERCKSLFFQVDFHLPTGSKNLIAHFRIMNPTDKSVPIFLWTNIAVREVNGCRVFSGTEEIIIQVQSSKPGTSYFSHCQLPDPLHEGIDHSYPLNIPHSEEYYFQNDPSHAFEAVVYPNGETFYERSTGNYPYRKMFCWGNHAGGKRWQDQLSLPGQGEYLEIQSGMFRTQQHSGEISPKQTISITQLFGSGEVDYQEMNGQYNQARMKMEQKIENWLPEERIELEHRRCCMLADAKAETILHEGSGWGALEKKRNISFVPIHLEFPLTTIGEEQQSWIDLLEKDIFQESPSFLISTEWVEIMKKALSDDPKNTHLLTHLGIASYENGQYEDAKQYWEKAVSIQPNSLALRNLAFLSASEGDFDSACTLMAEAIQLLPNPERAYAEEYILWLTNAKKSQKAFEYYKSLPVDLQESERILLNTALSAFEVGNEEFLNRLFSRSFATIREGDTGLIDLWIRYSAQKEAKKQGVMITDQFLDNFRKTVKIPQNIDFRMVND